MKRCRDCRYFSGDPGVAVSGELDIGRCCYGGFLGAPGERACGARTLDAGEVVQLRTGGFAVVAENQPARACHVVVRRLHTTEAVSRACVVCIDEDIDEETEQ